MNVCVTLDMYRQRLECGTWSAAMYSSLENGNFTACVALRREIDKFLENTNESTAQCCSDQAVSLSVSANVYCVCARAVFRRVSPARGCLSMCVRV